MYVNFIHDQLHMTCQAFDPRTCLFKCGMAQVTAAGHARAVSKTMIMKDLLGLETLLGLASCSRHAPSLDSIVAVVLIWVINFPSRCWENMLALVVPVPCTHLSCMVQVSAKNAYRLSRVMPV